MNELPMTIAEDTLTIKAWDPRGFEIELKLQGNHKGRLLNRALLVLSWLHNNGFRPTGVSP